MADDALFDFLHMEIVGRIAKSDHGISQEQQAVSYCSVNK